MSRDNRHSSAGRDRPVLLSRVASLLLLASLLGGCSLLSGDETAPAAEVTVRAEPGAPGEAQAAETSGEVAGAQAEAAAPTGGGEAADSGQAPEQSGNALIPAAAEGPAAEELGRVSIVYPPDNADLPETVTAELDKLAEQLSQNGAVRVELHAYAGGDEDQASKAKLYSLKRGMKVRSYLYQAGVEAPRILLRPLGLETSEEPADRVDIILLRDEEAVPQTRVAGASQFVPATGEALTQGFALADSGEAEAAPQAQPVAPVAERPLGALEALGVVRSGPAEIQAAAAPPTEAPATASPEQGPGPDASVVPSAVAGPLPQGDAGLAAEDSLTARFEALAATDVQLAATPEQQATIARRGGTLVSTDGDGNVSTSETQLAEALSEVPSGGEAAFASHFTPQSAAPELATPEPGALPTAWRDR